MDTGLLIRWGRPIAGREEPAVQLFEDSTKFLTDLASKGKISYFEPFLYSTSDLEDELGFFVVKGPVTEIFTLIDSEPYKTLVTKANLLLHHVRIEMLVVGEQIALQIDRFAKVRVELQI